ncbi:MAG: hypothetical protein JO303_16005 [Caulobacteraceae bacterium]|nr:hypothetical protein [Caulobacteraceae bacterium]
MDIHGQLMEFYATAVSLAEKHPEQVNNEVRNAVTHLARALTLDEAGAANHEIELAKAHVSRATRDAIKLAVLELHDRIQDACAEIKYLHGTLDPTFMVRRDDLTSKRKKVLRDEINGDPGVIEQFVQLFNEADELEKDLVGAANLKRKLNPKWRRRVHTIRSNGWTIVGALAIGVIAGLGVMVIAPDPVGFGNGIRRAMHMRPVVAEPTGSPPAPHLPLSQLGASHR